MVAAGIYLLARVDFLFTPLALQIITITGITTALLAAFAALSQHDIKKILAYSTISQLGLMVMALGTGATDAALIHLFSHAFFKACLFLAAGSVIHTLHHAQQQSSAHFDVQDLRNLGGLRKRLPVTFAAFVISGSALAGVPFLSGFLSKDAILTSAYQSGTVLMILVLLVSFLTVLYTFRMVWKVFMGEEQRTKELEVTEAPLVMKIPLVLLMLTSFWYVVSLNPFDHVGWLSGILQPTGSFHLGWIAIASAGWVIFALVMAYVTRNRNFDHEFLLRSFYLDKLYNIVIGKPMILLGNAATFTDQRLIDGSIHATAYAQVTIANLAGWFDRVVVDGSVDLVGKLAQGVGSLIRSFQDGKIQLYIFWASLTIIIFLIWTLF
jgi:NADH-quinone oxidoreductase subunit L